MRRVVAENRIAGQKPRPPDLENVKHGERDKHQQRSIQDAFFDKCLPVGDEDFLLASFFPSSPNKESGHTGRKQEYHDVSENERPLLSEDAVQKPRKKIQRPGDDERTRAKGGRKAKPDPAAAAPVL